MRRQIPNCGGQARSARADLAPRLQLGRALPPVAGRAAEPARCKQTLISVDAIGQPALVRRTFSLAHRHRQRSPRPWSSMSSSSWTWPGTALAGHATLASGRNGTAARQARRIVPTAIAAVERSDRLDLNVVPNLLRATCRARHLQVLGAGGQCPPAPSRAEQEGRAG